MTARRGEGGRSRPQRRPGRLRSARGFYSYALAEAERKVLEQARDVDGLDEEIALLRTKIAAALADRPEDLDLLLKGLGVLVRAVATRYRLSPQAKDDLYDSLVATLQGLGQQVFPREYEEAL